MSKSVLVVGADSGMGREFVGRLLAQRYRVIATVFDDTGRQKLEDRHPSVETVVQLDLADPDSARTSIGSVLDGPDLELSGVIVFAATLCPGPLEVISLDDYRKSLEVNNVAALMLYQVTMPALRRSKGWLAFVSSEAGKVAFPYMGLYISCKHALEGLCDVMRQEAAAFDVDVVVFEPGAVKTEMLNESRDRVLRLLESMHSTIGELYADRTRQFADFVQSNIENGISPAEAAARMMEELEKETPDTRCVIGQDAEQLLQMRRELSDREMDEMFAKVYGSVSSA